jgi:hypothetical protein
MAESIDMTISVLATESPVAPAEHPATAKATRESHDVMRICPISSPASNTNCLPRYLFFNSSADRCFRFFFNKTAKNKPAQQNGVAQKLSKLT